MVTYGKKKRNVLPFSAFQDDESEFDQKNNQSGMKMGTKATKQASQDFNGTTVEVADSLLNDTLHKGDSISIECPNSSPGFYQSSPGFYQSPPGFYRSLSNDMVPDWLNKPLPSIPMEDLTEFDLERPIHGISEADAMKSNALMSGRVHHKFPLNSTTTVTNEKSIYAGAVPEIKKSNAYPTTADAAELGRKLSLLMREPTAEDFRLAKTMEPKKLSVYVRAKQVITNHLGSSVKRKRRGKDEDLPSSSPDSIAGPEYMTDAVLNRARLDRRIAEGANLSKPKVRSLTGGTIPRKPLPVYMFPIRSSSLENPFSDKRDGHTDISSPEVDELGLDGDSTGPQARKARPASAIVLSSSAQLEKTTSCQSGKETQREHQFSEVVSGLTQPPPDKDYFSKSNKSMTRRYRLQAIYDAIGKKRLSAVLASSPSVLDFGFEDHSGDESSHLPEANMWRRK